MKNIVAGVAVFTAPLFAFWLAAQAAAQENQPSAAITKIERPLAEVPRPWDVDCVRGFKEIQGVLAMLPHEDAMAAKLVTRDAGHGQELMCLIYQGRRGPAIGETPPGEPLP